MRTELIIAIIGLLPAIIMLLLAIRSYRQTVDLYAGWAKQLEETNKLLEAMTKQESKSK